MSDIKYILCLLLGVLKVQSVAIHGNPLTRYDPCGIGAVHFDKLSDRFWQGVVNLGLYANLTKPVEIEVNFDKRVKIFGSLQNSTFNVKEGWRNFIFKPKDMTTSRYIFFVKIEDFETDVPIVKKFALNNYTLCDDAIKASVKVESLNVTEDEKFYKHVCGRRALENAELTTVRTESKPGDWPWHIALFVTDADDASIIRYECGGNIISRTAIVTAGHCVSNKGNIVSPDRITIVAGVSNHKDLIQVGRQTFTAEEVHLHPNYNDVQATADLAVIKISNLRYTEFVQPICIWGPVYDKTNLYGYQATVVGFGSTEDNIQSDNLRATYTVVQNDTTCIDFSTEPYQSLLNEFTFCAGFGPTSGINPRNGDSGGGLVVPTMQSDNKISWFLRGVLSKCGMFTGETSCDPNFYVVYTDVGPHYGWLYHHSGLQYRSNIA